MDFNFLLCHFMKILKGFLSVDLKMTTFKNNPNKDESKNTKSNLSSSSSSSSSSSDSDDTSDSESSSSQSNKKKKEVIPQPPALQQQFSVTR